jgi:hypothetical protein
MAPSVGHVASDSAVFEVYVQDLSQLFHSMDPAPFHEKDLDREAEAFIVDSAKDLATDGALALVVYLDQTGTSGDETRIVGDAIRVHFARRAERARRDLRQLLRRGRTSLAIGLPLLGASVAGGDLLARLMDARPLAEVLRESLVIGGSVAMWRPMDLAVRLVTETQRAAPPRTPQRNARSDRWRDVVTQGIAAPVLTGWSRAALPTSQCRRGSRLPSVPVRRASPPRAPDYKQVGKRTASQDSSGCRAHPIATSARS